MKNYLWIIPIFIATCTQTHAASIIATNRTFIEAWQAAGYPGQIPAPAKIVNVRDFGALGNGIANDQPAVVAAMTALSNNPGVVYFPAGQYVIPTITKPVSGTVFRGERPENTSLVISNDPIFYPFYVLGNQATSLQAVTGGYTSHSSVITVTDGSVFSVGDYAEIVENNDPALGIPTSGWAESLGQILQIAGVSGNTLTLALPLRLTYQASLAPSIRKINMIKNVGFENLGIRRVVTTAGTATWNNKFDIDFTYAANCWVRGILDSNTLGAAFGVERSTHIEITGSYVHDAHCYGGGGEGYGIKLQFHPGECKFENNMFRLMRHSMALQAGADGVVFGYNYSRDTIRVEFPSNAAADIQFHGSCPNGNLCEGNIIYSIQADTNSGDNGPLNTFFRNRTESGYGILIGDSSMTNQNWVGNEVGGGGTYSVDTGFAYGNNTSSGVQPAGATSIADYSYYLTNDPTVVPPLPVWWNITNAFPTVGLPLPLANTKVNPAYARYNFGAISMAVGPPSLGKQPTNLVVIAGSTAMFSVQATGTPVAVFQWFKDGVSLTGQTNAAATIVNAQPTDSGNYYVYITDGNPYSVTSASASLTVTGGVTCTFSLSSSNTNVGVNGAPAGFSVIASVNTCAWTATADVPWIGNLSPTNGIGTSEIAFSVGANASGLVRTGHVTVAGIAYTVTQDACDFSLSASGTNVMVNGSSFQIFFVSASGTACTWMASTDAPWIGNLPANETGSSNIIFTTAANASGLVRTGHVTAAGLTYTVTQDACGFSLLYGTSTNISPAASNLLSVSLTANGTSCTWTASVDVPWLTGLTPGSGTGSGSVSCSIPFNPNSSSRIGHITIAGLTFTVTQAGATSSFNDGVPDWWRQAFFGTSGSTNPQSCAMCDADGTGQNNLFKYVAGLDPTNPASVFTMGISPVPGQPGKENLVFAPVASGRTYTPLFNTNLTGGGWLTLSPIIGPVTNGNAVTITDPNATDPNEFYHINISLP